MGGEVAERAPKGGKKGLRRPKRRISIRIDMTPMVDIAFLLLIFYMVTTVFAMPQAMEINLPPIDEEEEIEIKESNLLTVRVDGEGVYWWNLRRVAPDNLPQLIPTAANTPDTVAYRFNADSLQGLLIAQNRANDKLNSLVLIHRDATYADMVNILDEIDLIERSWNAYTAEQLGVKIGDIPRDQKFSYRYAIGEWEDRDDKIMDAARQAVAIAQPGGE
ncbi:MAG: biopolymer transporter ExbD [candidate division Zixibacteria bacterium]|nr:biopolymer transporter ExbD [candidate division Zixibacteria bacterium]